MTERLYYHDADLLAFDAAVVDFDGPATRVILDRTAFYPTSGGQPHDTGTLGVARVLDVIDADDRVIHVVDTPLALGPIHGEVDSARRRDHMQQHSAQHLLSALAADRFGWDTASVHFGPDHSSIEFDVAAIAPAALAELEMLANASVAQAHPVAISIEPVEQAAARGLRKPSERGGDIRVVSIATLDRSACGGTHVANTAAIGAILLHGVERIRGHVRVGFLAGARLLAHVHAREALLSMLAQELSCAIEELPAIAAKRQADLKALRDQTEALEREVAGGRLHALLAAATPDAHGVRRLVVHADEDAPTVHRILVQQAGTIDDVILLIAAHHPPAIYFAAGAGSGTEAGPVLKAALTAAGGRGGGSARVAQGSLPTADAIPTLLRALGFEG